MVTDIKTIGVIGLGIMGHSIAQEFATFGFEVACFEADEARVPKALASMRTNLELFEQEGLLERDQVETILGRIKVAKSMEDAASAADYIVEAIPEVMEPKQEVIRRLCELTPKEVIIATNTSGLDPTEIAKYARYPERFIVTHYWNPPHLIPLVEVTRGAATSDETLARTLSVLEVTGKEAVVLKRYVPGFIGNRLQWAILREALALVEDGVADPEDVDRVMTNSLGRRYSVVGPLETADMGGLNTHLAVGTYLLKVIDRRTVPPSVLKDKVEQGHLGLKTGQGFYEWPAARAAERCRERDKRLLGMLVSRSRGSVFRVKPEGD